MIAFHGFIFLVLYEQVKKLIEIKILDNSKDVVNVNRLTREIIDSQDKMTYMIESSLKEINLQCCEKSTNTSDGSCDSCNPNQLFEILQLVMGNATDQDNVYNTEIKNIKGMLITKINSLIENNRIMHKLIKEESKKLNDETRVEILKVLAKRMGQTIDTDVLVTKEQLESKIKSLEDNIYAEIKTKNNELWKKIKISLKSIQKDSCDLKTDCQLERNKLEHFITQEIHEHFNKQEINRCRCDKELNEVKEKIDKEECNKGEINIFDCERK